MDNDDQIPASGDLRDIDDVANEFDVCVTKANLYLPDDVIAKLRPFGQWAYSRKVHQAAPDTPGFNDVYSLLAKALKGD